MAAPMPLYGGNPCGTGALARPGAGVNPASLHMDDLAAAMLWANAQDIHCPKFSGPGQDIPDAFYVDPPDGPGFATTNKVGDMNGSSERATAITNIQRGVTRLALGILPSILAVLEMLVNLVFGLSLVALWLGLPLGLAFIFFEESSASIAMLLRQGFGVLKVSWASAFLMAILFAALKSSAEMGNAAAYTGLAGGSIILMGWLLITAFGTLGGSVKTLSSSVMTGTGLNIMQPVELAAGAATLAAGALTGGAALAATAAAAYQQTGSGRYAAGAAAGRIGNLAQLGEVAAAMGYLQDEEVVAGLHAGDRSTQSYRSMRLQMVTDARRKGSDGLTMPERAQERSLAGQLDDATDPGAWRGINAGVAAAGGKVAGAYTYARSGQGLQDARDTSSRLLESIGDSWHRTRQGALAFGAEVDARANAAGTSALGELGMVTRGAAAAIAVTHDRLSPDGRYQAYRLDDHGQMQTMQRQDADGALPPDARTVPNAAANLPRLLRQGYVVQQNPDQTVTIWQADPQKASAAATPQQQLAQLYKDGALSKDEIKRAAAATIASGTPSAGPPPQKYLEVPPPEAGVYHVRAMADGQARSQHQLDSADAVADLAAEQGLPVRMVASDPKILPAAPRASDTDPSTAPTQPGVVLAASRAPTAPRTQSRVERLATSRSAHLRPDAPTVPAGTAAASPPPAVSQPAATGSQARGEALAAPAQAAPVAQPASASQPAAAMSPTPGEAPAELVGAAPPTPPATATVVNLPEPMVSQAPIAAPPSSASQPAAPAVLPEMAARWLDQVGRQAPRATSAMPVAPARMSATMANHEDAAPATPAAPATHQPAQPVGQDVAQEPETIPSVPGADTADTSHTDSEKRAN